MTEGRLLADEEFAAELAAVRHTAFRLEVQPRYNEPCEEELLAAFVAGNPPAADTVPELRAWYQQVADQVRDGKRIGRVRVQKEPPTPYQRFERWMGRWNLAAGEDMRYLTQQRAYEIGLLPAAGDCDWWLLDSCRLLVMRFDGEQRRVANELIFDPVTVLQACMWRDLAVHYSVAASDLQGTAAA